MPVSKKTTVMVDYSEDDSNDTVNEQDGCDSSGVT